MKLIEARIAEANRTSLQRNDRHERNKSIGERIHSGVHHIMNLLNSTMDAGITNVLAMAALDRSIRSLIGEDTQGTLLRKQSSMLKMAAIPCVTTRSPRAKMTFNIRVTSHGSSEDEEEEDRVEASSTSKESTMTNNNIIRKRLKDRSRVGSDRARKMEIEKTETE